jgi:hypothetical protein
MKTGDLVWDFYEKNIVLIVKKKTNVIFICFLPNLGRFIPIRRKELKPLTPKQKL